MEKIDINSRYLQEEEVRKDIKPYFDYFQCLINTIPNFKSFCDIGCATGHLLYFIKKMNNDINVKGYEYFSYHKNSEFCNPLIKNNIEIYDIRDPLPDNIQKFDIVNCSEVGEHIDPNYADILIENAKKLSNKYIIFTWSSHGGEHDLNNDPLHQHLNPLSRENYIKLMKKHNLKENINLTNHFMNLSLQKSNFYFWWRESFIIWEL